MTSKLSSTAVAGIEVATKDQGIHGAVPAQIRASSSSGQKPKSPLRKAANASQHPKAASNSATSKNTKAEMILKKLRTAKGASIEMLIAESGWQAHSVRGFLSAVVKKKLALNLASESGRDGVRRYRIDGDAKSV
jgi:hypothetical protein